MKAFFIAAALFLTISHTQAQDTSKKVYTKVYIESLYPGGTAGWNAFLGKNFHYPDDAVNNEIQGDVVVQFEVDEQGNVSNIQAVKGPTKGGLREEAVRVIKASGQWRPALQNGVAVKSVKKQTLSFRLSKG
ncbi:MAG TPA: energy transducer TonB [Puia sp.]|nr:energy transducer TonB [Puia sp.]